ncbi:MAG: ferric reductase-like transmembrane domain-containing protein [Pseudomonadota bacterium]
MPVLRTVLIWLFLVAAIAVPIALAAQSPFLAWREPVYILASFAGIIGLVLLLIQPMLAAGWLPGLPLARARYIHRWTGGLLVMAILIHVGGLWITSPPDVVDALLFVSPTPFSVWGVVAMWAVFAAALLASLRRTLHVAPRKWRLVHTVLACVIVVGTVVHALLIEGAMETLSKVALCVLVTGVTLKVIVDLRAWVPLWRRGTRE